MPSLEITTTEGVKINLSSKTKSIALVFYRGAWCPYCIKQLKSIENEVAGKLESNSILAAISVDKLSVAKKMKKKNHLSYHIVSDPKALTLEAFKIINKLDNKLVQKYKETYKIDVERDSGETHHMVAHPGVFIIQKGIITYADIHLNYKNRTDNKQILKNMKK